MSEQCKKHVYSGRRDDFRGHQCGSKAKKDGLCTIHQPEYIAERNRKAAEAYTLKWENTPIKKANRRIAELEAENAKLRDENAGLLAACDSLTMDNDALREDDDG
jgi:hypothetical protein